MTAGAIRVEGDCGAYAGSAMRGGTVLALMGENGAGKSTLMKIIAGIYQPDSGELRLKGRPVTFATPLAALQAGIA
ncbi:ATP-binding cassette domain-containing protein, partial [Burkholderia sp. SIMBA_045]